MGLGRRTGSFLLYLVAHRSIIGLHICHPSSNSDRESASTFSLPEICVAHTRTWLSSSHVTNWWMIFTICLVRVLPCFSMDRGQIAGHLRPYCRTKCKKCVRTSWTANIPSLLIWRSPQNGWPPHPFRLSSVTLQSGYSPVAPPDPVWNGNRSFLTPVPLVSKHFSMPAAKQLWRANFSTNTKTWLIRYHAHVPVDVSPRTFLLLCRVFSTIQPSWMSVTQYHRSDMEIHPISCPWPCPALVTSSLRTLLSSFPLLLSTVRIAWFTFKDSDLGREITGFLEVCPLIQPHCAYKGIRPPLPPEYRPTPLWSLDSSLLLTEGNNTSLSITIVSKSRNMRVGWLWVILPETHGHLKWRRRRSDRCHRSMCLPICGPTSTGQSL